MGWHMCKQHALKTLTIRNQNCNTHGFAGGLRAERTYEGGDCWGRMCCLLQRNTLECRDSFGAWGEYWSRLQDTTHLGCHQTPSCITSSMSIQCNAKHNPRNKTTFVQPSLQREETVERFNCVTEKWYIHGLPLSWSSYKRVGNRNDV